MTARPWPHRYTRARLASGAKGFLFVPRVGTVEASGSAPFIDHPSWTAPYEDEDGNEVSEDGINPGTLGPGLSNTAPMLTDDDGTTRQLKRDGQGAWRVKRTPVAENYRNLDWRNADGSDAMNWLGPPSRYWGFTSVSVQNYYQPEIFRRGKLYATAPERVIGCALAREDGARIVVAATTSINRVDFTQDFDVGQVDETNLYVRIAGGDPEATELFDQAAFDAKVAEYELANTDEERETLRGEIQALARGWHDLALRGHEDLVDTSVPEQQSAEHPRRRTGADVWPMHFNASGNEGQTLRRQSAWSEATLANGADISADVHAYRYERIKVSIGFNVTTVTVDAGKSTAFDVRVLAPAITPARIHGDRLPRLDITPQTTILDTSEEPPTPDSGVSYTAVDLDNSLSLAGERTGQVVAAVDYDGETEVFARVALDETVSASTAIEATATREAVNLGAGWTWLAQLDTQSVSWSSSYSRNTAVTLVLPETEAVLRTVTVTATLSSASSGTEAPNTGTTSYDAEVNRLERTIGFLDLRQSLAVFLEEDEDTVIAAQTSFDDTNHILPHMHGESGPDESGWYIGGDTGGQATEIVARLEDVFTLSGPQHNSSRTRGNQRRVVLDRAGEAAEVLMDRTSEDTTDLTIPASSAFPLVSLYVPPFRTDPNAGGEWGGLFIRDLATGAEGDPGMSTSGEVDDRALGGLSWRGAPVGNWAANHEGEALGSSIETIPIVEGFSVVDTEYEVVNHLSGGDLVELNGLTVPVGQQAAFYNVAFVGA